MHVVVDAIQSLPPAAAYAIIAALVFGEAAIFIGFVFPGETAVVFGGFLASTGQLNLAVLCSLVVVSAVVGDSIGYEVGRRFGPRVIALGVFEGRQGHRPGFRRRRRCGRRGPDRDVARQASSP